ncbi:unnamed protein product [Amoebophrya sp. A25]|nr:unnamed protein product [Amoebophrya sp. A25]|eukprot:GSA25T00007634001.1
MSLLCRLSYMRKYVEVILASGSPRRKEILGEVGVPFRVLTSSIEEEMSAEQRQALRDRGAAEYTMELSRRKIEAVWAVFQREQEKAYVTPSAASGETTDRDWVLLIAADTCIELEFEATSTSPDQSVRNGTKPRQKILDKPVDRAAAIAALHELRGRSHSVVTGVSLRLEKRSARASTGVKEKEPASQASGSSPPQCFSSSFAERTSVKFRGASDLCDAAIEAYVDSGEPMDKAGSYGIQGLGGLFVEEIQGCHRNVIGFPLSKIATEIARLLEQAEGVSNT